MSVARLFVEGGAGAMTIITIFLIILLLASNPSRPCLGVRWN